MTYAFPLLLLTMAGAALACRFAGFFAMRFLPRSPRLDAALRATPVSVMAAIAALALAQGGTVEALALATAAGMTLLVGNDVAAALVAVALAALLRLAWG